MTSTQPVHSESEEHPWNINVPNHPQRADSPEYVAARKKMNEIAAGVTGLVYGSAPFQDHHGGALWLKDAQGGWFLVRNLAGIEWSAQFCADPAKVDLLRQNAKRLYDLLAPEIKQELDPGGLLDTPIQNAAGVASWTDSIFNAGVPLQPSFHTGVLHGGASAGGQDPTAGQDPTTDQDPTAGQPASGQPPATDPEPAVAQEPAAAQAQEPAGVHHYPTPIVDIQLFKYDDFQLWVTDGQGNPAAVAPVAPRGSGNASVHVLYATPGSQLAKQKQAAESANTPLILGPDHPLAQQAYVNQQLTSQVGALEILMAQQLGGRALEHDLPGRQDVAAVGDGQRHGRVLLDHQDRDAGGVDGLDDLEVLLDQRG